MDEFLGTFLGIGLVIYLIFFQVLKKGKKPKNI